MFATLPQSAAEFKDWDWPKIEPFLQDLQNRPLTADNVNDWLADWTRITQLIEETRVRAEVATTVDTTDEAASDYLRAYLETIIEPYKTAEQGLRQKLLDSGFEPDGFAVPLRNLRAEVDLFRESNLPLLTEEHTLGLDYGRIVGAQTVEWDGVEKTIRQLLPLLQESDRTLRERVWRATSERQLADRAAINDTWQKLLALRLKIAANTGEPDYRAYRWKQMLRFDYTPDDCLRFQDAIEAEIVPAAARAYERRRQQLGVETLRPWDLDVDPLGRDPLRPFETIEQLESGVEAIFRHVDPALGDQFGVMRRENLLDLENRKGKAPGGYCTGFDVVRRPFIFFNAVGLHDDVQGMLHEGGHAFHVFAVEPLPYDQQLFYPIEFAEVASMSMELLGGSYLSADDGFYAEAEAARARIEHLEGLLLFWPYMAVVDALQHWVYTHPDAAADPDNMDATWAALWARFMPGVDWSGLDDAMMTGWHRKLHIFEIPFYYVEYGIAQLGAVQVWRNSLSDQVGAVANYRSALALGGTATLPDLFAAAGAKLALDAATLREAVELIEGEIDKLSS
jgi:oligoendopeptidase F